MPALATAVVWARYAEPRAGRAINEPSVTGRRRARRRAVLQRELRLVLGARRSVVAERERRTIRFDRTLATASGPRGREDRAPPRPPGVCRHDGQGLIRREPKLPRRVGRGEQALRLCVGASRGEKPLRAFEDRAGPVKPRTASSAARIPASAARPACRCLLISTFFQDCQSPRTACRHSPWPRRWAPAEPSIRCGSAAHIQCPTVSGGACRKARPPALPTRNRGMLASRLSRKRGPIDAAPLGRIVHAAGTTTQPGCATDSR